MVAAGILAFLLLSALFSGSEIAFVSANKLKIELKKKRGTYRSLIIASFYEKPADFLSTMLVGNNIALVAFTSLMTIPLNPLLSQSLGIESELLMLFINTIIITVVILIFGEFVPKTLFRLYADTILYALAFPLKVIELVLLLPSWLMTKTAHLILKPIFRQPKSEEELAFTRLDLENFVNESRSEEQEEIDKELFGRALNLRDVRVRECMVPRTEIENIDINTGLPELEALFHETKLSRLLVTQDDIDNVLGYVHHQQLFQPVTNIRSLVLDIPFVPEVMRVTDLMNKFIRERISIACVVDEFGGVSGLITLEDILEEIFGEIEDEHDEEDYIEETLGEGHYLFSGRLEIDYLNEKYHLHFPEGEYHTLSGYIVTVGGEIPEEGEVIEVGEYRFTMVQVSNTRIDTVRVETVGEE